MFGVVLWRCPYRPDFLHRVAMKKYLLPCTCGKQTEVDSTQSGLKVRCACGNELEVPTLRGLQELRVAGEETQAAPGNSWGPRQGLLFLAAVFLLVSVPAAGFMYWKRPTVDLQKDAWREQIAKLTPAASWQWWEDLRGGLTVDYDFESRYQQMMGGYHRALTLALCGVALGVLLAVAGLLMRSKPAQANRSSARPAPRAAAEA
jgi:hypothetical protein